MQPKLHALSPELESFASEPYYQVIGKEAELFTAAARLTLLFRFSWHCWIGTYTLKVTGV